MALQVALQAEFELSLWFALALRAEIALQVKIALMTGAQLHLLALRVSLHLLGLLACGRNMDKKLSCSGLLFRIGCNT